MSLMIRVAAIGGFLMAAAGIGPAPPADTAPQSLADQPPRERLMPSRLQAPGPAAAKNRKMKQ